MDMIEAYRAPERIEAEDEATVRIQLAALYRLTAHFGWTDLIYTHISARVPGDEDHFLINPFGLRFEEVTASNLVKVDHEGNLVEPSRYPINLAGFVIHSALHMAREDARCVMHIHTRAGVAVAALEEGLMPINQHALMFHNRLAYHDFEGIAFDMEERERLVADMGPHRAMILRNHGLLTAGRTIPEAFELMYYLHTSCQMQIDTLACGRPINYLSDNLVGKVALQYDAERSEAYGARLWPSYMRLVEKEYPGFNL